MYYAGSVGAMIVFDISNPNTLEAATIWKSDIEQKVVSASGEPVPVLLVGNKIDLVPNGWHMTMDQMEQFRLAHKFVGYIETSAKTAQNVNEAVRALVDYVVESGTSACAEDAQGIRLAEPVEREPSGCC
jgi:GTPase SAR1 family protein